MPDELLDALREIIVDREHKLDQLDEVIYHAKSRDINKRYIEAVGIKDGKARVIYVSRSTDFKGERPDAEDNTHR